MFQLTAKDIFHSLVCGEEDSSSRQQASLVDVLMEMLSAGTLKSDDAFLQEVFVVIKNLFGNGAMATKEAHTELQKLQTVEMLQKMRKVCLLQ